VGEAVFTSFFVPSLMDEFPQNKSPRAPGILILTGALFATGGRGWSYVIDI
jgi:hypothetical protein